MKKLSISQECALRHLIDNPFDVSDRSHLFHMTKPTNTLKSLVNRGLVSYEKNGGSSGVGNYSLTDSGKAAAKSLFGVKAEA
ncbi:hypothetical protein [Telmatospirillum siberiense]|nr:hypothetical protein [Telmatospirillum siberiense]